MIDKDFASELLAEDIDAELFVMATDVDAVYTDWGTPQQERLDRVTPDELGRARVRRAVRWDRRSRRPCRFVRKTGNRAAIGSLDDIAEIVDGAGGTQVVPAMTVRGVGREA